MYFNSIQGFRVKEGQSCVILHCWVGIQVRLKWCAIDYYLILRHVQTTEIGQNLLTNLRQPRRIYARNCNYDRPESQPRTANGQMGTKRANSDEEDNNDEAAEERVRQSGAPFVPRHVTSTTRRRNIRGQHSCPLLDKASPSESKPRFKTYRGKRGRNTEVIGQ